MTFEPSTVACHTLPFDLDLGVPGSPVSYIWYKDGIRDPLQTGATYPITCIGTYRIEAAYAGAACVVAYEKTITQIIDTTPPVLPQLADTTILSLRGQPALFRGTSRDLLDITDGCGELSTIRRYSLSGATTATNIVANSLDGVAFNVGVTEVTWYITDSITNTCWYTGAVPAGNTATTSFNVEVIDVGGIEVTTCSGEIATLTVSPESDGLITNPVFTWYSELHGDASFIHTGPTLITSQPITSDTVFYVSVKGDNYCEGFRLPIIVKVESCTEFFADKNATLLPNTSIDNGTYPNPVSILGNEVVKYEISTVNPTLVDVDIVIVDTLPAYMEHVGVATAVPALPATSITTSSTNAPPYPARDIITWKFEGVAPDSVVTVSFNASPAPGAVASQPLFINRAMVSIVKSPGDSIHLQSNGTFHQGAGISIMTFSASFGGSIYNAGEQALDYMSTPSSGVIIVPDEGYAFAGWSHDGYTSLRGETIAAQDGIMHYDTLIIYGNVELHASFVPVELSLDDLEEVELHATKMENKVWAVKDELFITTTKPGSIVRIYTPDGILREQHTIVSTGTTSRKLSRGIYIVTINNDFGNKLRIE